MAQKENEIDYSFWSLPGLRSLHKFFSFKSYCSPNHGFTLIEILVVVAVVGILAAGLITLINPIGQTQRAKDGQRRSDLRQIQAGLELYRSDQGSYPPAVSNAVQNPLTYSGTTYMKTVPRDPSGTSYLYVPNAGSYDLYSCAENDKSPEVKSGTIAGLTCSKALYFQVTSP